MIITAIIAVLAVSATNAYRSDVISSEVILAKYSPRTNYEVEKICEFAEQQNYKNQNEDLSDEIYGSRSVHGGVKPNPKTKQQIQRCCQKQSQFEKKQCLKNARENFLDRQCDIHAINHMCCKTVGESRYTCFTKNAIDRPWPSSHNNRNNRNRAAPSPFEQHDEVADPWVKAEERIRRQSPREEDVEQLRRELREPQHRRSWTDQGEDDEEEAQFTYRERVDDQQQRRQAGHEMNDNEEERRQPWDQDRAGPSRIVDAIREIERIREQHVFGQQPERSDSAEAYESDRSRQWERRHQQHRQEEERQEWVQPQEDNDQDIFESQQRRGPWQSQQSAEEVYEAERRRADIDAEERAARQTRWGAGGAQDPWTAQERIVSQMHQQHEKDRAMRRQADEIYEDQVQQARRDARRFAGTENIENEPIDIIEQIKQFARFGSDSESENEVNPVRRQSRQYGHIETAIDAAVNHACHKNARRDGRNVHETCCEAGSIVAEIASGRRHGGQICMHALHKFVSEVRGCGVSPKPECKQGFIHCCRRRAQDTQRRNDVNNAFEQERW